MAYKIQQDTHTAIIEIIYSGEVTFSEKLAAVDEFCRDYGNLSGPKRILIDVRNMQLKMSEDEQVEFGKRLALQKELLNAKVAVLHPTSHNPNAYIDAVAYNKGYRLAEFTDIDEAGDWLLGLIF